MNKKVILVGTSKSLLKNKLGEIIDNYDVVCRMNNGGRPDVLTNDYKNIIGSKRNIWLCKHIGLLNMFKDNGYDEVVGFPEADEFNEKCMSILNEFNEFKFQPTCGILSIIYLLEKYNKIHICGMDGFKGGHWYGNKFIATQEKSDEIAAKGFGRHNVLKEMEYINHLVKQNKIKIIDE
jgi:hypothetical protein